MDGEFCLFCVYDPWLSDLFIVPLTSFKFVLVFYRGDKIKVQVRVNSITNVRHPIKIDVTKWEQWKISYSVQR